MKNLFCLVTTMLAAMSYAAAPQISRTVDVLDHSANLMGWSGPLRAIGQDTWSSSFKLIDKNSQIFISTHAEGVVAEVLVLEGDEAVYHYVPLDSGETVAVDLSGLSDMVTHVFVLTPEPTMVSLFEDQGELKTLPSFYIPPEKEKAPIKEDIQAKGFGCRDLVLCNDDWTLTCSDTGANPCGGVSSVTKAGKVTFTYDEDDFHGFCIARDKILTWDCHSGITSHTATTVNTSSNCGCNGTATWTLESNALPHKPLTVSSSCPGGSTWNWNVSK